MAKQIYIDSNGNEVLVSGTITNDNNLPHYSGTPTAGTTAYEIASKQDKIKNKTVPVAIGTSTYSDYLYADVTVSDVTKDKIIGMYVSGNATNRPAFAILLNGNTTTIRLFANSYSQNTTFDVILTYYD